MKSKFLRMGLLLVPMLIGLAGCGKQADAPKIAQTLEMSEKEKIELVEKYKNFIAEYDFTHCQFSLEENISETDVAKIELKRSGDNSAFNFFVPGIFDLKYIELEDGAGYIDVSYEGKKIMQKAYKSEVNSNEKDYLVGEGGGAPIANEAYEYFRSETINGITYDVLSNKNEPGENEIFVERDTQIIKKIVSKHYETRDANGNMISVEKESTSKLDICSDEDFQRPENEDEYEEVDKDTLTTTLIYALAWAYDH